MRLLSFLFLVILGFDLLGWLAGFYLFAQWLRHRKSGGGQAAWIKPWAVGWISLAVLLCLSFVTYLIRPTASIGLSGFFLAGCFTANPVIWLGAFFKFRKWERQNRQKLKPDYGEPQEGVWPPPPNVPK